jgi:hypothetical protein
LVVAILMGWAGPARAQPSAPEVPLLKLERLEESLWLSVQLNVELPAVVEEALLKGIPIYFVAQADLLRERWYWMNKKVASTQRSMRLSYHPLTRRWRLNVASGEAAEVSQGLTLNQNFESLADAMSTIRRIFRWKIANLAELEPGSKHVVDFHFQLDVTQLPRPLQIGTLGQSDWLVSRAATQTLEPEPGK